MKQINIENIVRVNEILRLYDGMNFPSKLYLDDTFPTNEPFPPSEFKGEIIFKELFIGDYLQTGIKDECILNFASAKHPGGGVLRGTVAQEEDICRNSLLYLSLVKFNQSYYLSKKFQCAAFYKDFIIFSSNIPTVKRNLELGDTNHFITCAAPNLNDLKNIDQGLLQETLTKRIRGVFITAWKNKCKKLVLGPWGCGVFKNDPQQVAIIFDVVIGIFGGHFDQITFLVPDQTMMKTFKKTML